MQFIPIAISICYVLLPAQLTSSQEPIDAQTVVLSSSCNDKPDGLFYIKPTADGKIIPVICNQGYTMIDISLHFDAISSHFTSFYLYGDDETKLYGTDCSDDAGWRDWFIPANKDTKFRVAWDCQECKTGVLYNDNTAYYMTNGYFCPIKLDIDGCSANKIGDPNMQGDVMCNVCDDTTGKCGSGEGRSGDTIYDSLADPSWCDCFALQLSADHRTEPEHHRYCQQALNWRPSISLDRRQCTCYQPSGMDVTSYTVDVNELPRLSSQSRDHFESIGMYIDPYIQWDVIDDSSVDKKTCEAKQPVYLTQNDFLYGTYRITECGQYILTEDIIVNLNAPNFQFNYENGDSPNAYDLDNLYWFPTNEQQESGQYFGLNAFWGPYSVGSFAAITIETDYVNIDLGGYRIDMDYEFYLQQRFFAIIEFGDKPFQAGQGPVDFGRDTLCISHINIKNGVLGRSSHHGIHGSCVRHAVLSDLTIENFDVAGIQCNGCQQMVIENTDIGPQNSDIPVKGRYTHARILLARLRYLVNEFGDTNLKFANRHSAQSIRSLADTLVEQMDMVYYHIMQGIEFDEDNVQWQLAQKTFINPTGWLDGGSGYGILLNGFGTAVVNIGRRTVDTYDITLRNINIHDIKVQPLEGLWANISPKDESSGVAHGFFFETIDWLHSDVYDEITGYYKGDTYTDLLFAANTVFQEDFCPLGPLFFLDSLMEWVFVDNTNLFEDPDFITFFCASDIQSHSAKGAMGIRVDGVKDFEFDNVTIRNVINWGDYGCDKCGEYEYADFQDGLSTDPDIQYGYTGSKVHGILTDYASGTLRNIKIENLESWKSSAIGMAFYKGSEIQLDGDITVNNIIAGSQVKQQEASQLILPNVVPFVCSVLIGPNTDVSNIDATPIVTLTDLTQVTSSDIYGYDYCDDSSRVGNMITGMIPINREDKAEMNMNMNVNEKMVTIDRSRYTTSDTLKINSMMIVAALLTAMSCLLLCSCMSSSSNDLRKMLTQSITLQDNYGSF